MIFRADGDLLATDAQALVNTVNTVGVMGKGIALQFNWPFRTITKRMNAHVNVAKCKSVRCSSSIGRTIPES